MALKILCRVKKLTTHQGRDKKGVDCQCYHLSLKRSTNRNWFWKKRDLGVDERHWNPVIVEKASTSGSELVDLGDDGLESELVTDPTFLLCSGHHCSRPHKGHPVLWVLRRPHLDGWRNDHGTQTHLNALFIEALYDLPLVLGDDARFLHVAKCGESLLHLVWGGSFEILTLTGIIAQVCSRTV